MHGAEHPPPFAITLRKGAKSIRAELSAEDFALALAGRLVIGTLTRKDF